MKKEKMTTANDLHRYYINEHYVLEKRRKRFRILGILIISGSIILMFFVLNLVFG